MRSSVPSLLAMLLVACGSKSGLLVDEPAMDAAVDAVDAAVDVSIDTAIDTEPPPCPPGEDCDCLTGGSIEWAGVLVCPSLRGLAGCPGPSGRGDGWGEPAFLSARCVGTYTFCAAVEARDRTCELVEVCRDVRVNRPLERPRFEVPTFYYTIEDPCLHHIFVESGGEVCTRVSWATDGGERGERSFDCFLPFGPYCIPPDCGSGPPMVPMSPDPENGMWEF